MIPLQGIISLVNEITSSKDNAYISLRKALDLTKTIKGQFLSFPTQAKYLEKLCIIASIAIWKNFKYFFHLSLVLGSNA